MSDEIDDVIKKVYSESDIPNMDKSRKIHNNKIGSKKLYKNYCYNVRIRKKKVFKMIKYYYGDMGSGKTLSMIIDAEIIRRIYQVISYFII